MLRRAGRKLSINAKLRIYKSVIRPTLEYGSPAMLNLSAELSTALDRFQRRSIRTVRNCDNDSLLPLVDSLTLRRSVAALQILHSVVYEQAPQEVLRSFRLFPKKFARSTRLATANHQFRFQVPGGPRSSRQFELSFLPNVLRLWNDLPPPLTFIRDPTRFRASLSAYLRSPLTM